MGFGRRLRLFLFGALIGCALVAMFFGGRLSLLTDWLPNNRVLLRLQQTHNSTTEMALCQMKCLGVDTADVRKLKDGGDVRFKLSDVHSQPLIYIVENDFNENTLRMAFSVENSTAALTMVEILDVEKECPCGF